LDNIGQDAKPRQGMAETIVYRRRAFLTTRTRVGFVPLALAAAACLLVAGCSPGVDYPSIFPAVHDMPPPRADSPMDPDQVQQATEDLITERNHLTTQSQGAAQSTGQAANSANPPTKAPATKTQTGAAGGTNGAAGGNTQGAAAAGTQTAGAETK
jgi:hypothetical protein